MNPGLRKYAAILFASVGCVPSGTSTHAANVMTEELLGDYLGQKTCVELRILRNEIFARHGRVFHDPQLSAHFLDQEWYSPTFEPSEFPHEAITDLQSRNIYRIKHHEKAKECGKWQVPFNVNEWTIMEWSAACGALGALVVVGRAVARVISGRRGRRSARIEDL